MDVFTSCLARANHPRPRLPTLRSLAFALAVVCGISTVSPPAHAQQPQTQAQRFLLIVSGLGGEDYYRDLFQRWSLNLLDIAHQRYGITDAHTVYLAENTEDHPDRVDGISRKPAVLTAITDLAEQSAPGDRVIIMLIGHGTAQGPIVHFNLPGPDLGPAELAQALATLEGRRLAVINTAPASGAFMPALSADGRVVITATANAAETQHTRFAGFFIDALAGDTADADKDNAVSLLEAFQFARQALERAFESDNRLPTEHALLDDDGDGDGSLQPAAAGGDGALADRFTLAGLADSPGNGDTGMTDEMLALQIEARQLVDRVERLKRDKRLLSRDAYEKRLEALLVELALNRRAYRRESDR